MSTYQRQIADIIKHATTTQKWRERETSGEHHQLFAPDGKGIVTAPKNSTEHRAFANFMADMKRHGYKPQSDHDTLMANRAAKSARTRLLEYGETHPNGIITPQDAVMLLKISASAAQQAIGKLFDEGRLVRVSHGQYRWDFKVPPLPEADTSERVPVISNGNGAHVAVDEVAQPQAATPPPALAPRESESIRDADDEELAELATAMDLVLSGLARLEPIVKRHQKLARKLQDAKRAFLET